MNRPQRPAPRNKGPIRLTGVLFAFALCTMLVSGTLSALSWLGWPLDTGLLATAVAPLLSGLATTYYVGQRGTVHACLGGLISALVLALVIFPGVWQLAVFAWAFCTIGAALTEIYLRRGRAA